MSAGFLVAEALAEALRRPYRQGELNVTTQYLVEGLKIGQYRVLVKENFDTACWIPPVGKRGSHTIYYGDRMLERVVDRFCRTAEVTGVPSTEVLVADLVAEVKAKQARLLAAGEPVPSGAIPLTPSALFKAKVNWLKANFAKETWDALLEWIVHAVASYGRHERQHARETPRDMKQINLDLAALGIPFYFFNLFEDARIEHISRGELSEPFSWMKFEDLAPLKDPSALFLRCIQFEGEPDQEALDSEEPYGDGTRTLGAVSLSVQSYYQRACACSTAQHLYPVIQEFLDEFEADLKPPPSPDTGEAGDSGSGSATGSSSKPSGSAAPNSGKSEGEGGSGKGKAPDGAEGSKGTGTEGGDEKSGAGERAGDLSTAAEAAEMGDSFFDEFEADAEVVGGTDDEGREAEERAKAQLMGGKLLPPPTGKGAKGQGVPESIAPQASGGRAQESDFLAPEAGGVDAYYAQRVEALTAMLMRMFKTHTLPTTNENPGQRISGRHLARGELRFVHKRVFGGKGKRKFTFVYDGSSSMRGRPDREGKVLLLAVNNLAKRGYLEGSLILSGWVKAKPGWLQYELPVKDEVILRIDPSHGSEGIQDALKDNLKHLKGMDDVFVYTDANICDEPLDRDFFAQHRVWPVGLYAGSEAATSKMQKHFPQNIIRPTIEEVVEAMLTRNRRTRS